MKTKWDYTELAESYSLRPSYSSIAIDRMLFITRLLPGARVCDIGAGTGHLAIELLKRSFLVDTIEPNDAMRSIGVRRTAGYSGVKWHDGAAEESGMPSGIFDLVTFGSSLNVTEEKRAFQESHRILKDGGWFICMWNHRDLNDPVQGRIEAIIKDHIPSYDYGSRREDQTSSIVNSGLFERPSIIEESFQHSMPVKDCIEAWRSHATLARQAGNIFSDIIGEIEDYLKSGNAPVIEIPYKTKVWIARRAT